MWVLSSVFLHLFPFVKNSVGPSWSFNLVEIPWVLWSCRSVRLTTVCNMLRFLKCEWIDVIIHLVVHWFTLFVPLLPLKTCWVMLSTIIIILLYIEHLWFVYAPSIQWSISLRLVYYLHNNGSLLLPSLINLITRPYHWLNPRFTSNIIKLVFGHRNVSLSHRLRSIIFNYAFTSPLR